MEDALISPIGLSILTGAGLIEATTARPIVQHILETNPLKFKETGTLVVFLKNNPKVHKDGDATHYVEEPTIYVMVTDDHGDVISEPYLFRPATSTDLTTQGMDSTDAVQLGDDGAVSTATSPYYGLYPIVLGTNASGIHTGFKYEQGAVTIEYTGTNDGTSIVDEAGNSAAYKTSGVATLLTADNLIVDYYTEHTSGAMQIDITPDKFGGTFYLEASTLWRDQGTGKDLPAEFIIPKCKIQSNFSFTLSSSGDPSSFTFTMDAFPDYTRFDRTEKVLARIQVLGAGDNGIEEVYRQETWSKYDEDDGGLITGKKAPTT